MFYGWSPWLSPQRVAPWAGKFSAVSGSGKLFDKGCYIREPATSCDFYFDPSVFLELGNRRGIPSEKIGQNIHPLESRFFVINYQHWTSTSAFWPILAPLDHWGGLGGLGGIWGGLQTPKMTLLLGGHFRPWNALFWVITTCLTMFLRFWVKIGPSGPKKSRFWPK